MRARSYYIPTSSDKLKLSPLIYARAGEEAREQDIVDRVFKQVAGIPTELIGGSRKLFLPDRTTGRKLAARPAFMGYVAVSNGHEGEEVDVAFVWRGTIFYEEWQANFAQDYVVSVPAVHCPRLSLFSGGCTHVPRLHHSPYCNHGDTL